MHASKTIYMDDQAVGTAYVTQKGLYLHIICHCNFPDRKIRRIQMYAENEVIDLGVCVPEGDRFVIHKALPVKRIGAGELSFHISCTNDSTFIPVDNLVAFKGICKLQNTCLSRKNGKTGIIIKDRFQGRLDSDPSP